MNTINLEVQRECAFDGCPGDALFERLADHVIPAQAGIQALNNITLTIRLVDKPEIKTLNKTYRNKDKPTNVLSFPFDEPDIPELKEQYLGDIIICPDVVAEEAAAQGKTFEDHLSHMTIHGILHLLGYDHIEEEDATVMEALEKKLLALINIKDPYGDDT